MYKTSAQAIDYERAGDGQTGRLALRAYAAAQNALALDWPGDPQGVKDWQRLQGKIITAIVAMVDKQ